MIFNSSNQLSRRMLFKPPTFNPSDSSVAYQNRKKKYVYMVEYKDSWYNSSTQIHTVGYQKFVSC